MFSFHKDERTDRERYLEAELDRIRQVEERRTREAIEAREKRRREFQQQLTEAERSANDWPEALIKQSGLMRREVGIDPDEPEETDYFAQGYKACDAALKLWRDEAHKRQPAIEELTRQLEAIQRDIRHAVADGLEAQSDTPGWRHVAAVLRDDDMDPSEWLNW